MLGDSNAPKAQAVPLHHSGSMFSLLLFGFEMPLLDIIFYFLFVCAECIRMHDIILSFVVVRMI